jgi:hypothetical protein
MTSRLSRWLTGFMPMVEEAEFGEIGRQGTRRHVGRILKLSANGAPFISVPNMRQSRESEKVVWRGKTSALLNAWQYFLGALFAALLMPMDLRIGIIPLAICTWYWLSARAMRYELTSNRLLSYSGVLASQVEELALREIKDFEVLQPWFFRMFGLGTVILIVDESEYQPCIICVQDPEQIIRKIRELCSAGQPQ